MNAVRVTFRQPLHREGMMRVLAGFIVGLGFASTSFGASMPDDNFYLGLDNFKRGQGSLESIDPEGVVSTIAQGLDDFAGMAVDGDGNIYFGGWLSQFIFKATPTGQVAGFYGGVLGFGGTSLLANPLKMAFDGTGNLLIANELDGAIVKITPAATASIFGNVFDADALAFDPNGNLYVASDDGRYIDKLTASGVSSTFVTDIQVGEDGLAFDSLGNLFVSTEIGIDEISPTGTVKLFESQNLLGVPGPLAFDANGNLFVEVRFGVEQDIQEIAPDGSVSTLVSGLTNLEDFAVEPVPEPSFWCIGSVTICAFISIRPRYRCGGDSRLPC
jgi:hypothetical protein